MQMKITIPLDDKLVKEVRKIAADRGTTLSALIRDYLTKLTGECKSSETKRKEIEALERSFKLFHARLGSRT